MEDANDISVVVSSEHRKRVLRSLHSGPKVPSTLGEDIDMEISHVSRVLQDLRGDMDDLSAPLVELVVPEERRKGRIYALTDHGEEVMESIDDLGL